MIGLWRPWDFSPFMLFFSDRMMVFVVAVKNDEEVIEVVEIKK